jgi:hypothetical protein
MRRVLMKLELIALRCCAQWPPRGGGGRERGGRTGGEPTSAPHPNLHLCVAAELSLLHFQSMSEKEMEGQVG